MNFMVISFRLSVPIVVWVGPKSTPDKNYFLIPECAAAEDVFLALIDSFPVLFHKLPTLPESVLASGMGRPRWNACIALAAYPYR